MAKAPDTIGSDRVTSVIHLVTSFDCSVEARHTFGMLTLPNNLAMLLHEFSSQ